MRLGEDFIDEIKARVRPSDLIGRTVSLKRQGREFVGLSPFKKERSPSFFVNDEKRFYHCFASGKHGDVFTWLEEMEGLSFMEAAERLAGEAGLSLPAPDPQAQQNTQHRKSLVEWMEAAQAFYLRALRTPAAEDARRYLKSRGLSGEDCVRFGIGYAPESRTALKDELVTAGAPVGDLVECGLLIEPDSGSPYDRFRHRIMFPIQDPRGRLVAFGGRALSSEARAKYLNSPETPIFHKGSMLYRFPEARRAAADPKADIRGLIVAEGYLDVIALARAGLEQGVAPLGTAITEEQLQLLWRAGGEPVMCLDGDSAGRAAALKAADRALPLLQAGHTLRFAFMPDGKDPDDILREQGAGALREVFKQTRSLADLLWEREIGVEPLDDPDRRASFRRRIRTLLAQIAEPDIRAEYKREFDNRMEAAFGTTPQRAPWTGKGKKGLPRLGPSAELRRAAKGSPGASDARILLLAAIEWPELAADQVETLAHLTLGSLDLLRDTVLDACSSGQSVQSDWLRAKLAEMGFAAELRRLDGERGPMRAAIGGAEASGEQRSEAWIKLAAAYMERNEATDRREEIRARLVEEIGRDDSEGVRRLVEAYRRETSRSESS
ncbi:DNA primase [uncultured Maricaulis sp.]|uniref:DNA primase n=1 Tax=uncultured Maricaulis sp. TaxID=174710 RepID=UPI0030DA124B|tara:strand:+ start:106219 stop:108045 length:1827 start_codon:yes stop_codon:yes gene_type:complete